MEGDAFQRLKSWAKALKRDVVALYLAARDPRTPFFTKLLAAMVAGYALSPIDLIPDFIPLLGYLDDLVIVPIGIWLVVRLVPADLMAEYRARATHVANRPTSRAAAAFIVAVWIMLAMSVAWFIWTRR